MQAPHRIQHKQAFTLIELLVVMAIIAILMGITLGIAGAVMRGAAESKARAQIADLTLEIEKYKADPTKGSFPPDLKELVVWYEGTKYKGTKYLTTDLDNGNPIDPWGKAFVYARINEFVFRLGSLGPDGKNGTNGTTAFGTGDDITSQK